VAQEGCGVERWTMKGSEILGAILIGMGIACLIVAFLDML